MWMTTIVVNVNCSETLSHFAGINFADILYDRDPQVVSNCISALSEILAPDGGLVISEKIAHYLLNRLGYCIIVCVCVCENTLWGGGG